MTDSEGVTEILYVNIEWGDLASPDLFRGRMNYIYVTYVVVCSVTSFKYLCVYYT